MRVIVCSTALLAALMVPSAAADYKSHTFQVSTNIDRSNMLADTVSLKLDPSSITLAYDAVISTFADKPVKLMIESDVYTFDSQLEVTGYQLFLINNVSSCYSSLRPETENKLDGYDSIANVHIDNKVEPMKIGEAISYSDTKFDSASSVLTHDLMLKFKAVGDEDVRSCNGSFVVGFRYDL
ncbi:hypothetical protein [Vibrio bathopelagicus]|uniref:hypothetical protein n=1 Tax=Vibrio bathopelagicus TaxID=2777577 RepID=UPI001864960A|nr:hypothetical protein [Vibrio bathopelagicus]